MTRLRSPETDASFGAPGPASARLSAPAARSTEFPNVRGQSVRVLEIISPVAGGVSVRRTVVVTQPNDQEQWEETTTIVRPTSYWRTDVEVARSRETLIGLLNTTNPLAKACCHCPGAIGRPVIHDDDLEIAIRLGKHAPQGIA